MSWQELRLKWEQQPEYLEALERELPYREISAAVVGLRVERGLTQNELAELAHTTQSVISRMESGRHSFEIGLLTRVARAVDARWRPVFEPADEPIALLIGSGSEPSAVYRVEIRPTASTQLLVYTPATDRASFAPPLGARDSQELDTGRALSA